MGLPFISKSANVGHWIRLIPALAGGEAAKSIGGACGSLAQDDGIVGHEHVEAVPGFDAEIAPGLARNDDLVLGTDLHAKHRVRY